MIRTVINLILRLAFGGLFFAFGLSKVNHPITFLDSIRGYRFFEHVSSLTGLEIDAEPLEAWIAMGLPWLEIFCGVAVLIGIFDRGALAVLCGLVLAFIIAIASAWNRNLEISCGCFTDAGPITDYRIEILQRIILLGIGIYLLVITVRDSSSEALAEAI